MLLDIRFYQPYSESLILPQFSLEVHLQLHFQWTSRCFSEAPLFLLCLYFDFTLKHELLSINYYPEHQVIVQWRHISNCAYRNPSRTMSFLLGLNYTKWTFWRNRSPIANYHRFLSFCIVSRALSITVGIHFQ